MAFIAGTPIASIANEGSEWKSWSQEFETQDLRIKALENLIGRQVETINESDSIIKKHKESINSLRQLIATKNAELDSLRIKNMELTARLNQP